MKLIQMSTHDFAARAPGLAFWPVGTIEAHDLGPLGTDVLAPQQLASDLAPQFEAVLLPALPFGLVSSLAGYPGGMWMTEETYRRLVFELLSSLTCSRITQVIVFNGHGGNTKALGDVLPEVYKAHGIKTAFLDWWSVGQDLSEKHFGAAGGHGGADELALACDADPSLDLPAWDGSRAFRARPGAKVYPAPRSAIRYGEGDVKPLTRETAEAFCHELRQRVAEVVGDILSGWRCLDDLGDPGVPGG